MQSSVPIFQDTESAAAYLQLSASCLEKWRVLGRGPRFRKHGRQVRYVRADLDAWSESQVRNSTAGARDALARPIGGPSPGSPWR